MALRCASECMAIRKNIVISNVFGSCNRGDAALVEVLVENISRCFESNAAIYGIARFPELESTHIQNVRWLEQIGKSTVENALIRRMHNVTLQLLSLIYTLLGHPHYLPFPLPRAAHQ